MLALTQKNKSSKLRTAFGASRWTNPILIDEGGKIIAGEGRYKAAILLCLRYVPVIMVSDLNETLKRALVLADNKIAENSGWNLALLAEEIGDLNHRLPEYSLDIQLTGFEPPEVDLLLGDLVDSEQDPADEAPKIKKAATSRLDDLWVLDRHRLLCGDARKDSDLRKLIDGQQATMIITDPPYNLKIASIQGRGKIRHREFVAASGEMSREQFTKFLIDCLSHAAKYSIDGSIHYVFIDWRHLHEMLAAGEVVYSEFKNLVVWNKTTAGMGTFYRSKHELIFVYKNGEAPHINNFELGQRGRSRSNVWNYPGVNTFRPGRMEDLSAHPTVKPIALLVDALRDCSRRGDIILDLFIGSGTTIVAAERVGRRAYGLELDPLHVDAAVRRCTPSPSATQFCIQPAKRLTRSPYHAPQIKGGQNET